MENGFIYLIKASGLIGMFYFSYFLLLRRETFFSANRWFLLLGLITSSILPLFFITKIIWVEPTTDLFDWSNIPVTTSVAAPEPEINWYLMLAYVYFIGIAISFLKLVFDFNSLIQLLKGKTMQQQGNFKLIDISQNIAPFSYFNYIVYNSSLYTAVELENILEHEKVHSQQKHSIDVLISRLFCVIFWFNPLIWSYKKAIAQNLEFIADNEAAKKITDKKTYQLTLVKITTQENCVALTNHFYQPCLPAGRSLIKKRIIMLNKNQSKKWNSWKYITVFPALVAFVFLFQIEVVAQEKNLSPKVEQSTSEDIDVYKITKNSTEAELKEKAETILKNYGVSVLFSNTKRNTNNEITEITVEFNKGNEIAKNRTVKGTNAIKPFGIIITKNSTGNLNINLVEEHQKYDKLVVSTNIVSQDNKIPDDTTIFIDGAKSDKTEMDKLDPNEIEKIDVIKKSGNPTILVTTKYHTNKISKTIINNQEDAENSNKTPNNTIAQVDEKTNVETILRQDINNKPLIIVDGVKQASNFKVEEIPTDQIDKIDVLKGINATGKYGESGENGAIEITTKIKKEENNLKPLPRKKVQGFQILK